MVVIIIARASLCGGTQGTPWFDENAISVVVGRTNSLWNRSGAGMGAGTQVMWIRMGARVLLSPSVAQGKRCWNSETLQALQCASLFSVMRIVVLDLMMGNVRQRRISQVQHCLSLFCVRQIIIIVDWGWYLRHWAESGDGWRGDNHLLLNTVRNCVNLMSDDKNLFGGCLLVFES